MLFLNVYRIDGEYELQLDTRHLHPSMATWAWAFSLSEITDPNAVRLQRESLPALTVTSTGDGAQLTWMLKQAHLSKHRATIERSGEATIELVEPRVVHQVLLDLRQRGTRPLSHSVSVVGADGQAIEVENGIISPALVNALDGVVPWSRHCVAQTAEGLIPLNEAASSVLESYLTSDAEAHRALEAELRRTRSADVDVDNARYLTQLLRGALGRFAPIVEFGSGAVRCSLHHSLGSALIIMATSSRPTALTLQATLPTAPTTSLSMTSPDGLIDAVRNWRDVRCGVDAIDRAYVIDGDATLAAAVANAAGDTLLQLGRNAAISVGNGALSASTTTTELHPGAHASLALRLAELWESLLRLA